MPVPAIWLGTLLFACAAGSDPAPPLDPVNTMRISGTQDFAAVTARYFEVLYGSGGDTTFEVVLAPGVYEGFPLSLTDGATPGKVSLVVRGEGDVVFRSTGLDLAGPSVEVDGIRFEGARTKGFALAATGEKVRIAHVAFLDQDVGDSGSGSRVARGVLKIGARGPAATAEIEDAWLLGGKSPALAFFEAQAANRFASVTFRRSGIVATTGPAVAAMVHGTLRFEGCLLAGEPGVVPLVAPISKGRVEMADSVVIGESLDAISVPATMGSVQPMEFVRATATGSTVYVRAPEGDKAPGMDADEEPRDAAPALDLADLAAKARKGLSVDLTPWR